MRSLLLPLIIFSFFSIHVLAQSSNVNWNNGQKTTGLERFSLQFDPSLALTTDDLLTQIMMDANGSGQTELRLIASQSQNQQVHDRYQQFYQGRRVLGAQALLHSKNGIVSHANGFIASNVDIGYSDGLTEQQALQNIIKYAKSNWLGGEYSGKLDRSFPITGEPIICDAEYPQSTGRLTKAWLFEIYTLDPLEKRRVIMDASNGDIIMDIQVLMTCGSHKNAAAFTGASTQTLYHGRQDLSMSMVSPGRLGLRTELPGTVVEVLRDDTTHFTDDDGTFFIQDTALWSGAVDAYWSTIETMDFFYQKFARRGITNQDMDTARSFMLPLDLPYNNAFWDGQSMFYGKGDDEQFGPFTSIDICAHEVTHGVTQHTSGLEYTHESGALNEAFSDIFGKTIEFERSHQDFSWELGGRIGLDTLLPPEGRGFRNMADPWKYTNPKYYKGRFWYTGRFDNGGVHFNSGVLNHWFYLLVEGGSGKNEKGDDFSVTPIGFEKAIELAYDVLTNYLTPTSQYIDAKDASVASITMQYGICSVEHESVAAAWHAVGLGEPIFPPDLSASTYGSVHDGCLHSEFQPQFLISNNSCSTVFPTGSAFDVYYEHNGDTRISEQLILTSDLLPGESHLHTFSSTVTHSELERTELLVGFESESDTLVSNNEYEVDITWRQGPDFDISLIPVFDNRPICERGMATEVFIAGEYHGCTPIYSTDSILVSLELNGEISSNYVHPLRTVYPGGYVLFNNFPLENLRSGQNRARIKLEYLKDPNRENDWEQVDFYLIDHISNDYYEGFDTPQTIDSSLISITQGKFSNHHVQSEEGKSTIVLTGSSIFNSDSTIRLRTLTDRANMLLTEHQFLSNIHLCYDGKAFIDPILEFEVKHEPGSFDYSKYGILADAGTLTSVHWDGFVEYLVDIPINEFVTYTYPLPKLDTIVGLTIRNLALSGDTDPVTGEILYGSDRIFYNYIRISDRVLSAKTEKQDHDLQVSPNPVSENAILSRVNGQDLDSGEVVIFSSGGQVVFKSKIDRTKLLHLSLIGVPDGLYTVLVKFDDGDKSVIKLMKKQSKVR